MFCIATQLNPLLALVAIIFLAFLSHVPLISYHPPSMETWDVTITLDDTRLLVEAKSRETTAEKKTNS